MSQTLARMKKSHSQEEQHEEKADEISSRERKEERGGTGPKATTTMGMPPQIRTFTGTHPTTSASVGCSCNSEGPNCSMNLLNGHWQNRGVGSIHQPAKQIISPATSPGGSSTNSQRSFHWSTSVSNLRKSGLQLVKRIPTNIRRSSLAMFQMHAMGTVGSSTASAAGIDEEDSSAATQKDHHRMSADSSSAECHHQLQEMAKIGKGFPMGTAAKRAMRKRISAAKTAIRKISRISTHSMGSASCSTTSSLSIGIGTSSSPIHHSSSQKKSATISMPSPLSMTVPSNCDYSLLEEEHPCSSRKCLNHWPQKDQQIRNDGRGRENKNAELRRRGSSRRKKKGRGGGGREGGEENGTAAEGENPRKKRSWAATIVAKGRMNKGKKEEEENDESRGRGRGKAGTERPEQMLLPAGKAVPHFGMAKKQPLVASLSWDPQQQQRSRTSSAASQTSRLRVHSDGSTKGFPNHWPFALNSLAKLPDRVEKLHQFEKQKKPPPSFTGTLKNRRKKSSSALTLCHWGGRNGIAAGLSSLSLSKLGGEENNFGPEEGNNITALELSCLHCALMAQYRTTNLRAEIEFAVKRLAARLSSNGSGGADGGGGGGASTTTRMRKNQEKKMTTAEMEQKRAAGEGKTKTTMKTAMGTAEKQMEMLRRQMGTPDIVVSSCNSEETPFESGDEGFWTNASSSAILKNKIGNDEHFSSFPSSSIIGASVVSVAGDDDCCSPLSPSSTSSPFINNINKGASPSPSAPPPPAPPFPPPSHHPSNSKTSASAISVPPPPSTALPSFNPPMDTLKPPGFPFGMPSCSSASSPSPSGAILSLDGGGLNSPPRSNSVDLSQLRRDIELWSVSSLSSTEMGIACSAAPGCLSADGRITLPSGMVGTGISTPGGDSIRTVRSRSYDPCSSPEHMLRRPSRIEHLSEIFRKALAKSPVVKRAAIMQEQEHKRVSKHRTSRYWLDEQLTPSEHIWLPSSSSGGSSSSTVDTECYLGEKDCEKLGEKRRCAACHIVAHTACFHLLAKMNLTCKTTFRDCHSSTSSSRRQHSKDALDALHKHHWVHRWRLEGRCFHCGKSFQQKMFRDKEVIAITCSWCKRSYHNKRSCFSLARFDDHCDRGVLREMILPPSWLHRLRNNRRNRRRGGGGGFRDGTGGSFILDENKKSKRKYRPWLVKQLADHHHHHHHHPQLGPMASSLSNGMTAPTSSSFLNGNGNGTLHPIQPLLVFVNPKSGGNKGAKALNTLCWLLNPRQVFDINTMRGPKYGLEMFRKANDKMRILVCGGDGTVGWVLSTLDQLNWQIYPPIALLPLGTGNDLSRSMGWGGTFSDEPMVEMLQAIQTETSITHLDRWRLDVLPLVPSPPPPLPPPPSAQSANNPSSSPGAIESGGGNAIPNNPLGESNAEQQKDENVQMAPNPSTGTIVDNVQTALPLSVMNNYFSIGADAHVALQFHHSRSANPQMLNSRLKNRIAYGGLGTIDLFKRTWKDLSDYIIVECDGVDITPKIREFKFHCILFHNISFYAGGTIPWGPGGEGIQENCGEVFSRPSPCDGKMEILGFTTATLAALQMGGRGERIAQCSSVRIQTSKPIPMQVDGEPCLLGPSLILLSFHNKVPMLRREKFARVSGTSAPANNIVSMNANRRKSSNHSSSGGGGSGGGGKQQNEGGGRGIGIGTASSPNAAQKATQQDLQHKNSRGTPSCYDDNSSPTAGPLNSSVFMRVPILVVGRYDYDMYRDATDRLKDTGFELGTMNVEPEMELAQLRLLIQQMLVQHQILPYEPGREWRFLDYVSNAEEGAFRVSRQQEQCRTVADIGSLEDGAGILILDDAFPSMVGRSAAIGHELVFSPAAGAKPMEQQQQQNHQNLLMRRRISETLRIVLSSGQQETYL